MYSPIYFALVAIIVAIPLAIIVIVRPRRVFRVSSELPPSLERATGLVRARNASALGVAAAAAAGCFALGVASSSFVMAAVTPLIIAIAAISVFAIVPAVVVRDHAGPRSAELVRRTLWQVGPRWMVVVLAVASGVFVVSAITFGVAALPDGASFGYLGASDDRSQGNYESIGPFPGFAITVPVAVALVALLGLSAYALRRIADAPRPTSDDLRLVDDALRRSAARFVLCVAIAATGLAVGIIVTAAGGSIRIVASEMPDIDDLGVGRAADLGQQVLGGVIAWSGTVLIWASMVFVVRAVVDAVRKPVRVEVAVSA